MGHSAWSGFLITGQSTGGTGGSLWTEESGVATYDGDISANGVTVGKGKGTLNTIVGC